MGKRFARLEKRLDQGEIERDAIVEKIASIAHIVDSVPTIVLGAVQTMDAVDAVHQRVCECEAAQVASASDLASVVDALRREVSELRQQIEDLRRVCQELKTGHHNFADQLAMPPGPVGEREAGLRGITSSSREDTKQRQVRTVEISHRIQFEILVGGTATDELSQHYRNDDGFLYTALMELIRRTVGSHGRILDAGAHIGGVTLAAAALGYEVVAVEASPRNVELLKESVERNRFTHVQVVHAAVSDELGMVRFLENGPYGQVLHAAPGSSAGVDVPAIRLDDLLDEIGWERPDFIKLDVEGSELAAIRGMRRRLALPDAPPLFFEANGHTLWEFGLNPNHLLAEVQSLGYRPFLVRGDRLFPIAQNHFQALACVDYLALKVIPAALASSLAEAPLPHDETVADILAMARTPADVPWSVAHRTHIARALSSAPQDIRNDPKVAQAVTELQSDPSTTVRVAASPL